MGKNDKEKLPDPGKMMSYEEFAKAKKNTPYIFEIDSGGKKILFYGSRHSNDPNDPMMDDIRTHLDEFNPDLVLVEGSAWLNDDSIKKEKETHILRKDEGEMITKHGGEMGLGIKFALESGIKIESPEPEFIDEVNYLVERGYERDDIFLYYGTKFIQQYQRLLDNVKNKIGFEKYATESLDQIKRDIGWAGYDFSLDGFRAIFKNKFGKDFDISDPLLSDTVDPIPWPEKKNSQSETNEIARHSSYFRDYYIMNKVAELSKKYNRIFIIFGSAHAIKMEPALRDYFSQ